MWPLRGHVTSLLDAAARGLAGHKEGKQVENSQPYRRRRCTAWVVTVTGACLLLSLGLWRVYRVSSSATKRLHGGLMGAQEQLEWGLTIRDRAAVREALARGADPNQRVADTSAVPPLVWGVNSGSTEILVMLLDAGADPNAASRDGLTALYAAAVDGNSSAAQLLLDHGANADGGEHAHKGVTPLHWAAHKGDNAMVALLLRAGADRRRRDNRGLTAADEARRRGNGELARLIESYGP